MKLSINGRPVEIDKPATICQAAESIGIEIPTLCQNPELDHFTSCMMCMVKDKVSGRLMPACSTQAADGMDIDSEGDQIRAFRKSTLELLLSDHVGDCEAPCQTLCPLQHDVPRMIRAIRENRMNDAIRLVRESVAIPSILERFCNVPCERGCRRGKHDQPLSIRNLTRLVADWDLRKATPHLPDRKPSSGKQVLICGAGISGLSAAYYLTLLGHGCVVIEATDEAVGRIQKDFGHPVEDWVLEGELNLLRQIGIQFHFGKALEAEALPGMLEDFDAVVVAIGGKSVAEISELGLPTTAKGLKVDPKTFQSVPAKLFACGSLLKPGQPMIKSVATAQDMAFCLDQFLREQPITGRIDQYNHTMGRLLEGEMEEFLLGANRITRQGGADAGFAGLSEEEAAIETTRCLHCDCRANQECKLRRYSDEYNARQSQFAAETRGTHQQLNQGGGAIYEPGKCVKCGICVRLSEKSGERFGFAFVGRGYDVTPGVALGRSLNDGFGNSAEEIIQACPTGALAHDKTP